MKFILYITFLVSSLFAAPTPTPGGLTGILETAGKGFAKLIGKGGKPVAAIGAHEAGAVTKVGEAGVSTVAGAVPKKSIFKSVRNKVGLGLFGGAVFGETDNIIHGLSNKKDTSNAAVDPNAPTTDPNATVAAPPSSV